jgi:hypothetical protein
MQTRLCRCLVESVFGESLESGGRLRVGESGFSRREDVFIFNLVYKEIL